MPESLSGKKALIEGRVANIISTRELAINIGAKDGVVFGMKFKVMAAEAMTIKDPTSGAELGKIDREKVRVEVSQVNEKFSICRTYKTIGGSWVNLSSVSYMLSGPRPETLKIEDSSLPLPLPEKESYVKIGDKVIELTKEELTAS